MAKQLLACTGWEPGGVQRDGAGSITHGIQDLWDWVASEYSYFGSGHDDHVRNGRHAFKVAYNLRGINYIGQTATRIGNKVYYVTPFFLDGFNAVGNLQNGDEYVVVQFTNKWDATDNTNKFLGMGFWVVDTVTKQWKVDLLRFNSDGSFDVTLGQDTFFYTWDSGQQFVYVVTCIDEGDTNRVTVWVEGAKKLDAIAPGTIDVMDAFIYRNGFVGGKGSESQVDLWIDDWAMTGGSSRDADAPASTAYGDVLYQPNEDMAESDWTGSDDVTNKYRNVDDENDSAPEAGDKITPTATNDEQYFGYADEVSGAPLGVRIMFEEDDDVTVHTPMGQTDGADTYTDLGTPLPGGHYVNPSQLYCWFGLTLDEIPETGAWTKALLNTFEGGLKSGATLDATGEVYIHAFGTGLTQPAPTPNAGTAVCTLPSLAASASGIVTSAGATGTAICTLPSLVAAASGTMQPTGTAAATLPSLVSVAAGAHKQIGTAVCVLPSLAASATGVVGAVTGTVVASLPSLTASGAGTHKQTGIAICALPSLVSSAVGEQKQAGTIVAALPSLTCSASGMHTQAGSAAGTLPSLIAAATGIMHPSGVMAATLPSLSAIATGAQSISGSVSATLPSIACLATGKQAQIGVGTAALPSLTCLASGKQEQTGTIVATLPSLVSVSVGTMVHTGTGVCTLPSLGSIAEGTVGLPSSGALHATLPRLAAVGAGHAYLALGSIIVRAHDLEDERLTAKD